MRLDPAQEVQLHETDAMTAPALDEMPLAAALASLRAPKPPLTLPPAEAALVEDRDIPGPGGTRLPVRIYRPAAAGTFAVLLHFHGGGWVGGSISNDELRCHRTSRRAGIMVISVAYRLAPEHQFPAGLNDAYAALVWVHENAADIGADPRRIGVSGASAGGNLATAICMRARDEAGPPIRLQLLAYPICDTSLTQPSHVENANAPLLTSRMMAWFIAQYLPPGANAQDPLVAPLQAPNLRALPPALIITAECDPLRDEGMDYAARLREAGVAAEAICYPGVVHGFITRSPQLPQAEAAMSQTIEAIKRYLTPAAMALTHVKQGQGALPPGPPPRAQPLEPGPGR